MTEPRITDMERWEGEWQLVQKSANAGTFYTEDDRDGNDCDDAE